MKLTCFKIAALLFLFACCLYYIVTLSKKHAAVIFAERPSMVSYPIERLTYEIYYTPSFLDNENALYYSELLIFNARKLKAPNDIVEEMQNMAREQRRFAAVISFGQIDNIIAASGMESRSIFQLLSEYGFQGFSLEEIVSKNIHKENDSQIGGDAANNKILANLEEWEKAGNFQIPRFVVSLAIARLDTDILWKNTKKIPSQYDVRPHYGPDESDADWMYVEKAICRPYSADLGKSQAELNITEAVEHGENYYKLEMPARILDNLRDAVAQLRKNQRVFLIVNGVMVDIEYVIDQHIVFRMPFSSSFAQQPVSDAELNRIVSLIEKGVGISEQDSIMFLERLSEIIKSQGVSGDDLWDEVYDQYKLIYLDENKQFTESSAKARYAKIICLNKRARFPDFILDYGFACPFTLGE